MLYREGGTWCWLRCDEELASENGRAAAVAAAASLAAVAEKKTNTCDF